MWDGVVDLISSIDLETLAIIIGGFAFKKGFETLTSGMIVSALKLAVPALTSAVGLKIAGVVLTITVAAVLLEKLEEAMIAWGNEHAEEIDAFWDEVYSFFHPNTEIEVTKKTGNAFERKGNKAEVANANHSHSTSGRSFLPPMEDAIDAVSRLATGFSDLNDAADETFGEFEEKIGNPLKNTRDNLQLTSEKFSEAVEEMKKTIEENEIEEIPSVDWGGSMTEAGTQAAGIANEMVSKFKSKIKADETKKSTSNALIALIKASTDMAKIAPSAMARVGSLGTAIGKKLNMEIRNNKESTSNALISTIKSAADIAKGDSSMLSKFANLGKTIGQEVSASIKNNISADAFKVDASVTSVLGGGGKSAFQVQLSAFAAGGFPEDGWFRASKGEYFGQFDDGTSYIANNDQITNGIADAVYPAVYNAVSSALKNNSGAEASPEIRVFIGDKEITDVAIKGINERTRRTGKTPINLAF